MALLISLLAVGQIGFNLPLSSLGVISRAVEIGADRGPLVLSTYVAGLAVGFLISGPLADRVGRRPVLVWGLVTFIFAESGSAVAWNEATLLGFRILQGAGAAAAVVVGRAVARDLYEGAALTRVTTQITIAMAIVPGLAPILGSALTSWFGWRTSLAFGGALGAALLTAALVRLPDTDNPNRGLQARNVLTGYLGVLRDRRFIVGGGSSTLALSALYAFFAGAPAVLMTSGGLTPTQFSLVPVATAGPYILGGWLLTRVADDEQRRRRLYVVAGAGMLLGCTALTLLGLWNHLGTLGVIGGTGLYLFGLGIVLPTGSADAVMPFPDQAGVAGALLGALQMLGGALAGAIVSAIGIEPRIAFPAIMTIAVTGSLISATARPLS